MFVGYWLHLHNWLWRHCVHRVLRKKLLYIKMSKKYILMECLSNINDIIKQPLQQTQRIKFTSFDVSPNYLIFGASSGGIYIFSRHPCKFIKLIPSKEGSITNIATSPDEKAVAIATKKYVVVIIENCFSELNLRFHSYSVPGGSIINDMKWCSSELYCGSQTGQVSVISRTNLLPKTIFQASSEPLMNLDSSITQIEVYLKYLLVSTRTRTYLCNIEQEEYKQIGKKLRDGNFGACFYEVGRVKIYCARPGCRLWETDFESNVVCTHQFRDSLNARPSDVIRFDDESCNHFEIVKHPEEFRIADSFNFGKIKVINNFIITFNEDGFYIFDVETVSLVFWVECKDIVDLKVFDSFMYIWTKDFLVKCFRLIELEKLLCKLILQKKYNACAEITLLRRDDVLNLIKNNRLHAMVILKEELSENVDLLEQLSPVLDEIKDYKIAMAQKLESGIFLVDNSHSNCHDNKILNVIKTEDNNEEQNDNSQADMEDSCMKILYSQYQLNKINSKTESLQLLQLLCSKNLDEVTALFQRFPDYLKHVNVSEELESKIWRSSQVLHYVYKEKLAEISDLDCKSASFSFLEESFVHVNGTSDCCECSFPLPTAKCNAPYYYNLGCEILKKNWLSNESISICRCVPYMYKYLLELRKEDDINTLLPLLIQYNNLEDLRKFCPGFSYDTWDTTTKLFIKLKKNVCLNCEHDIKFETSLMITWTDFGKLLVEALGGPSTIKLLARYSMHIPPGELDTEFYQTAMFTTVLESLHNCGRSKAANLFNSLSKDQDTKLECDDLLVKYLNIRYTGTLTNRPIDVHSLCSICEISLQSSILDTITKLTCGHHCHTICSRSKELCKVCDKNL